MPAATLWQLAGVALDPARLRDVTLAFEPGVTAVIGWSGAGKTSLLNLLVGFERPSRGEIRGAPRVAWVPQSGGLWSACRVREHLTIAGASAARAAELLAAFDLTACADAHPPQLSGGEQARLAVARALAGPAEVLVMDEPLAHVDPARAGRYWSVLRAHLAASGASLVFATHLPEIVLGEADRAICLREGTVLHAGPVRELYAAPASPELMNFLGPGNWLPPAEAARWLPGVALGAPCVRPEQLAIEPDASGPFVVNSARFMGSVEEVELRATDAAETRAFFHRPPAARLTPGARVRLRLLSA